MSVGMAIQTVIQAALARRIGQAVIQRVCLESLIMGQGFVGELFGRFGDMFVLFCRIVVGRHRGKPEGKTEVIRLA